MATLKYLLQSKSTSAPVYCRLSLGKASSIKIRTGLVCDAQTWNTKKGQAIAKGEKEKALNTTLLGLHAAIMQAVNEDGAKGREMDKNWLQGVIDAYFGRNTKEQTEYLTDAARKYIESLPFQTSSNGQKVGVTPGTLAKYQNILNKLLAYEQFSRKRILASDVNSGFRTDFINYLSKEQGLASNTIGRYIRFVKTFALYARKIGMKISPDIAGVKGYALKTPKVILSFEELEQIKGTHFTSMRLNWARDWLIIGCYTGQRVSDLLRMNTGMIREMKGYRFIEVTQKKTGKQVLIPVHPEVQTILERYGGHFPRGFGETPGAASTLFNRYLKTVCKQAGLVEPTKGNLRDEVTGKLIEGEFEKWRLVSTHTCRRSFATNFYGQKEYPTPVLMSVTGHATEKQFLEYIGKSPLDYSIQLAEIWADKAANGVLN